MTLSRLLHFQKHRRQTTLVVVQVSRWYKIVKKNKGGFDPLWISWVDSGTNFVYCGYFHCWEQQSIVRWLEESDKWKVGYVQPCMPMPAEAGSGPGRAMASLSSDTLLLKTKPSSWLLWLPCLHSSFTTKAFHIERWSSFRSTWLFLLS